MDSWTVGMNLGASTEDAEDISSVHSALTDSGFEIVKDREVISKGFVSAEAGDDMQDEDWEDLAEAQKHGSMEPETVNMEVNTAGASKTGDWVHLKELDRANKDEKAAVAALVQEHTELKGALDATKQTNDVLRQQLSEEAQRTQQLNAQLEASNASKQELENKVAALLAEKAALEATVKSASPPESKTPADTAGSESAALGKVEGLPKYVCKTCSADLALGKAVLWSDCRMGKTNESGMLFSASINADRSGAVTTMHLATGDYEVVDVRCRGCNNQLGWRYLKAFSEKNKFKEGTTIMYKRLLTHVTK